MFRFLRTNETIYEVVDETDLVYKVRAKSDQNKIYSKSKCQTEVVKQADYLDFLTDEYVLETIIYGKITRKRYDFFPLARLAKMEAERDKCCLARLFGMIWVTLPNKAPRLEPVCEFFSDRKERLL